MKRLICIAAIVAAFLTSTATIIAAEKSVGKVNLSAMNVALVGSESEGQLMIEFPSDLTIVNVQHLMGRPPAISVTFKGVPFASDYQTIILHLGSFSQEARSKIKWRATSNSSLINSIREMEQAKWLSSREGRQTLESVAKRLKEQIAADKATADKKAKLDAELEARMREQVRIKTLDLARQLGQDIPGGEVKKTSKK